MGNRALRADWLRLAALLRQAQHFQIARLCIVQARLYPSTPLVGVKEQ
jgi:hypothetical protein